MYKDTSGWISQNKLPLFQTRQLSGSTEELHQQGLECQLHNRAEKPKKVRETLHIF